MLKDKDASRMTNEGVCVLTYPCWTKNHYKDSSTDVIRLDQQAFCHILLCGVLTLYEMLCRFLDSFYKAFDFIQTPNTHSIPFIPSSHSRRTEHAYFMSKVLHNIHTIQHVYPSLAMASFWGRSGQMCEQSV
jgi:hypothetical protein